VRESFGQGFDAVGHECGRTMAWPSSLPCFGVEFKIDLKAPGVAPGLNAAAVVWIRPVVRDDGESFG